ncbi:MAG: restriction endonuclease subunit S [Niveispirillum sp.]|nr:restriction endonuclease subunit S [Niveispirillum sp.]
MSGELPPGWVEATVEDIKAPEPYSLAIGPFGSNLTVKDYVAAGVPLVFVRDIRRETYGSADTKYISEEKAFSLSQHYVNPGEVLVTKMGDPPGDVSIYPSDRPRAVITSDCIKIKPDESLISSNFLALALRSRSAQDQILERSKGVAQQKVSLERFRSVRVPLPPLPEQHRIVERIEALLAKGAKAKAALDTLPALLDRYRQSLLAAAFRGDLTADWRMANPASAMPISMVEALRREAWERGMAARGLNPSRRRYYPAESGQAVPPLSLPDDWQWVSADVLCWEITVGHVGPMKERYVPSGIPFLRSQNVKQNRVVYDDVKFIDKVFHGELQKSVLHPGDIVVVRTGYPGTAAVIPELHAVSNCADLVISRPTAAIDPEYLSQYINSPLARIQIEQEQVGVAQQHFNVGSMSCLMVPFPTLEEQRQIAIRLKMEFQRLDSIMKTALSAASQHTTLTQSILAKAFRGELVPQAPADGPASVLLDRIRAGRAMVNGAKKRSVRRS